MSELREALADDGIALQIDCDGELKSYSIPALSEDALDAIAHGLPGRRWVCSRFRFEGLT